MLKIRMSSRYTTTKELVKDINTSSINLMKVVGAFVKPNGMTNHSKIPSLDLCNDPFLILVNNLINNLKH
jgi:hypothetical protein